MFYVFYRKNKQYDWLYLLAIIIIFVHWFVSSECVISYLEKKIFDDSYKLGDYPSVHPSSTFYQSDPLFCNAIMGITCSFYAFNIYILLTIYKVPHAVIIAVVIAFLLYIIYWRIVNNLEEELKVLRNAPLPDWITESPYLYGVYKRKISKKITITDAVITTYCYCNSGCYKEQIDWKMFEEHCAILRKTAQSDNYDYVVGIESGGAFVARAMTKHCKYIKISKYDDNPNILGEPIMETPDDLSVLRGKTVLLVDEHMLTGATLNKARNHILEVCGARKVDRAILYTTKTSQELGIEFTGVPFFMSRSPWGFSV